MSSMRPGGDCALVEDDCRGVTCSLGVIRFLAEAAGPTLDQGDLILGCGGGSKSPASQPLFDEGVGAGGIMMSLVGTTCASTKFPLPE